MKKLLILIASLFVLASCAAPQKAEPYDYSALKASRPKSILVVMPVNNSVDVKAEASVLARTTYPLAELGYYVYPVALVDEVFKQNGLTDGQAIRQASLKKIHEIFGADAIFYVNISEYGTSYKVFDSVTTVAVDGKLVDVKTGKTLWEGSRSYAQGVNGGNNDAIASLINAALSQIIDTTRDKGYQVAAPAVSGLIYYGKNGGLLIGPRHPNYQEALMKN